MWEDYHLNQYHFSESAEFFREAASSPVLLLLFLMFLMMLLLLSFSSTETLSGLVVVDSCWLMLLLMLVVNKGGETVGWGGVPTVRLSEVNISLSTSSLLIFLWAVWPDISSAGRHEWSLLLTACLASGDQTSAPASTVSIMISRLSLWYS